MMDTKTPRRAVAVAALDGGPAVEPLWRVVCVHLDEVSQQLLSVLKFILF
jgi:hypothetical protein